VRSGCERRATARAGPPYSKTLERDVNAMRFRAKNVSASENGDYYQVAFENRDAAGDAADVDGPDSPYLLIQCQFEDPDGGECYQSLHKYMH